MNYQLHYDRLIERARGRVLDGYKERHHVVPKCMGGTNAPENLVYLTPEEHYVSHQLLVRIHPKQRGLAYAAIRMAKQCTGNRAYGWLRRKHAKDMLGTKRHFGKPHSVEARAKMSQSKRGRPLTPLQRAARIGRTLTAEHCKKLADVGRGRKLSVESIAKMRAATIGKPLSPEHKEKLRIARNMREPVSLETRDKMSASHKGKKFGPMSAKARGKLSAALKEAWASGKASNQWTAR